MSTLDSLKDQKNEKLKDKAKLEELMAALSPLAAAATSLQETLKEASESIGSAGTIGGAPFDGGKTEEYATNIKNVGVKIDEAIKAVDTDIKSVEREIRELDIQIDKERERLAALQNTSNPTSTSGSTSRSYGKGSKKILTNYVDIK